MARVASVVLSVYVIRYSPSSWLGMTAKNCQNTNPLLLIYDTAETIGSMYSIELARSQAPGVAVLCNIGTVLLAVR